MPDYRRILIIKPSSLGDIIHALPSLAALRDRFPSAHITWLVKRQWAGVLERVDGLDRIWPIEPGLRGWARVVPPLRAAVFDLVIDLQGLFRSGAIAWLTGCPTRVGFANAREGSPFCYTHRVTVPTLDLHAVDRYLLIASAVGAAPKGMPEFRTRLISTDPERVAQLLKGCGVAPGAPWIAMNVSARWDTKRWPPENFAAVADAVHKERLGPVALIGGPHDRAATQAVLGRMHTQPIDLTGQTSPDLLPALLASASVLVTNDSGPMHIAVAMGTPVVALFGPTSPVRTGPYGAEHRVFRSGIPCSPCFSRTCRHSVQLECLTTIDPKVVIDAVREQLKKVRGSRFEGEENDSKRFDVRRSTFEVQKKDSKGFQV
jgi:heptosyltransferase I